MRLFPTSLQSASRPRLACEIAPDGIMAAGSTRLGAAPEAASFIPLAEGVSAGLESPVFPDRSAVASALREAFESVGGNGRDWTIVVPDACARVLLLDFDTLPTKAQEVLPLIRFRLRRMVPFDVDTAAVSYQILKRPNASGSDGAVRVIAAAMPAEVRNEIESAVREQDREPGALLPSTLAALAALPESGSHLLVHTGVASITTAITREGDLVLYRRTDLSEADPGEMGQAVLVAAAYYEDTLQMPLDEVWVAGFESPDQLRIHLEMDGAWKIPLRSLINSEAFAAGAVPGRVGISRFASVVGALRG